MYWDIRPLVLFILNNTRRRTRVSMWLGPPAPVPPPGPDPGAHPFRIRSDKEVLEEYRSAPSHSAEHDCISITGRGNARNAYSKFSSFHYLL